MIKNVLQDIVRYTHKLGVIDLVKVVGTSNSTDVSAVSDDKTIIIQGKLKFSLPEFEGTFGMPNISKLNTILSFDEYDDNSIITVNRMSDNVPSSIHFETKNKDFINDYRLMGKNIVEERVKNVTFAGAPWHVEFSPSKESILRLKKQSNANNDVTHFSISTENNNLKIYFGNTSSHSGNFVFESNVTGTISQKWCYPVKAFISILDLPGDKIIRISDKGAANIVVNSEFATYNYYLPATK